MEGWAQYRLEPPNAPVQMQGKLFLRSLLGSAGLETSLNVVPPGKGMPFLHKHRENDEVYVVVGGRGRVLGDAAPTAVQERPALPATPPAPRARPNTQHTPPHSTPLPP